MNISCNASSGKGYSSDSLCFLSSSLNVAKGYPSLASANSFLLIRSGKNVLLAILWKLINLSSNPKPDMYLTKCLLLGFIALNACKPPLIFHLASIYFSRPSLIPALSAASIILSHSEALKVVSNSC